MVKTLRLLHFNDVYNIEPANQNLAGGAARFASLVKACHTENAFLLFSGDCFSPSLMSTLTRGKQMPPILNALNVQVSCLGNHDLDFGVEHFRSLIEKCNFPWLVANVIDKETGRRLGDLEASLVVEWNQIKIGIVGLVEQEWLTTLATLDPEQLEYLDFVQCGQDIAKELRNQGCELIIALTHMRQPNDEHLLGSVAEIDIVMGGHDHGYAVQFVPPHGNLLVKSGTDFRDLTCLDIEMEEDGTKKYQWEHKVATKDVEEDLEIQKIVEEYVAIVGASLEQAIGYTAVPLEGRFQVIRSGETNLGNFVCDVLRQASRTDICFINSGTFRSDRVHPKGSFTKRDLMDILPMVEETVVLLLTGQQILESLENGVSQFPKLEGRFLQVSGIRFCFDPSQPSGNRIVKDSVFVEERQKLLEDAEVYSVCTKDFLRTGKDGFGMLKNATLCHDCEESPVLPTCIRYHFMKLDVLNVWKRQVTHPTCSWVKKFAAKLKEAVSAENVGHPTSQSAVFDETTQSYVIAPRNENRIVQRNG